MRLCHPVRRGTWIVLCLTIGTAFADPANHDAKQAKDSTRLETVHVYAQQPRSTLAAEQALIPGGVSLIDSAELYQRNASNMADMLRYVPGVWATSGSTGDSTYLSIRGSNLDATNYDGNGVKLLQDGLPITAADGNNHNRDVDPLSTSYALVARGANALSYGASTLGGAINFITPTARDKAPLELYLTGGSFDQVQGQVSAGTVAGSFDGLVTVEARHWDGYREHQTQDRQSVYANGGWQFADTANTRLYLSYINNDQDLPGGLTRAQWEDDPEQANPDNLLGNFQLNVETWRIANRTTWEPTANSSLTLGLSYEEQDLYHPIVYSPFFSLLIDTEQRNAGVSVRYNLLAGPHDLLLGLDYGQSEVEGGNYSHEDGRRLDLSTRVDNSADSLELFLVDRWQFAPRWTAVYGAQVVWANREVHNTAVPSGEVRNPDADYDSINPRAGLIFQPTPDVELFANVSKLYEPPTNYELEDDARGNEETLDAMHGIVYEIGSRGNQAFGRASSWYWDVALYYADLKDEILSKDDPAAPGTSLSTNVDTTIHAGLETLFGASFALGAGAVHRLEPRLNLTINHFYFDDDPLYGDNELPAAPGYFVNGQLLYRHVSGFFMGPTIDIVDERYADFSNTYEVDGYELLGLRIGYTRERWELWGEFRNLTDEDYVSQFSVKDTAAPDAAILIPGEPRAAYVGVKLQF